MAIPAKLEELILDGKARFETFQCAFTELNIIPVESKEFIVVTGIEFSAANRCRYVDSGENVATIQRIELFDGNSYNHFFAKMGGEVQSSTVRAELQHQWNDLYCVFHNDLGIAVTVPKNTTLDWDTNFSVLDGSNGNAARKVVNQGTNPYVATPQTVLSRTRGFSAGTDNVPFNRKPNAANYSSSFNGGSIPGGSTNQFQITSEDGQVYYGVQLNYNPLSVDEMRLGWYCSIKYVRVFETGTNVR